MRTLPVTLLVAITVRLGDLAADLLERAARLGLDLLRRVVEPALPLRLELLLHPVPLRVGDPAGLGEDLLGVAAGRLDQRPVLLEQLPGLGAGVVGLLDRLPDPIPAGVNRLLHRPEDPLPQHEERDAEAEQRPDHEAGDDLDQGVGGDDCHL